MQVPAFLARQFYVVGSLRNTADGFSLDAQNPIGDGNLVGVGRIAVDGEVVQLDRVSAQREADAIPLRASDVDRFHPIRVSRGDRVTLSVAGPALGPGEHRLEVELLERDLGALRFTITDLVAPDGSASPGDIERSSNPEAESPLAEPKS